MARKVKPNNTKVLKSGLVEDDEMVKTPRGRTKTILVPYKARSRYKIVDGQQYMIEDTTPDNKVEDEVLTPSKRQSLLTITRNLIRNSSLFTTLISQLTTNVVNTIGGKVVLSLPSQKTNDDLLFNFSNWTRNADFHTGDCFNHLLKRVLREQVIGGDVVLLYDDGLIEDSGKVLLFESNEIVNVSQEVVEQHYGKGATISQGKVYNKNGRHIGTVVSKSQAGKDSLMVGNEVDPRHCYFLKKDPNANPLDCYWLHYSNNWREGRAISPAASSVLTLHQLEDLIQSELMASRRQSQIFCWLTQNANQEVNVPMPFPEEDNGQSLDIANMTNEQIQEFVKSQQQEEAEETIISFDKAKEMSVLYEELPEGYDAKQLQMTHPNTNVQTIVDFLANRVAASMGLSKVFITGDPEDSNWRSNQLFSFPAILEFQKSLEKVCDWTFYRFVKWAQKKGMIKAYVQEDFMRFCDWSWKGLDDLNPVEYQNGIRLALENNTKTYKEILGSDWKERLEQTAIEHKWMSERGICHPSEKLISGGQSEESKKQVEDGDTTTTVEETSVEETKEVEEEL